MRFEPMGKRFQIVTLPTERVQARHSKLNINNSLVQDTFSFHKLVMESLFIAVERQGVYRFMKATCSIVKPNL